MGPYRSRFPFRKSRILDFDESKSGDTSFSKTMHWVYILKSYKNKYYVGASDNLSSRTDYHNSGRVKSTRAYRPWKLIYTEQYHTLSEARVRENQIKKWKSRKAIERLIETKILAPSSIG